MRWFLVLMSLGLVVCLAGVFLLMRTDAWGSRPVPFFSAADDQVLLRQVPGQGRAPSFGGTPIHDACSVITIDSLAQHGVELNHDVTMMHDYLDEDAPPEAAVSQASLDSASHCYYGLSNGNWLQVAVHQTPTTRRRTSSARSAWRRGRALRSGWRTASRSHTWISTTSCRSVCGRPACWSW